jgi:hypothetical protein
MVSVVRASALGKRKCECSKGSRPKNSPQRCFLQNRIFHPIHLKLGPIRPAPGPVALVATHISRPCEPQIAWGLRMPTPK